MTTLPKLARHDWVAARLDALLAASEVEQVTLTGNLAYTLPAGVPPTRTHSVVFTQDATGGHTVTYGGSPVTVDTAAGAVTTVGIWPGGTVTYAPTQDLTSKLDTEDLAAQLDARKFGIPVTATTINAAIAAAAAAGVSGKVTLPPGKIELDAPLILRQGVTIEGGGGHATTDRPGTELVPSAGYAGVGMYFALDGANIWHHGGIRRVSVRNFASHGIQIAGGMGELSVIDEVLLSGNGGDGLRIEGPSTPSMLGRISTHGNGGAGLRFAVQTEGLTQVQYLAGDNNGESLMTVDSLDPTCTVQVLAWKAERWGASPGHPNVFVINDGNGGLVDLGYGRVHLGSGVSAANAIVRQTATAGTSVARVKVRFGCNNDSGGAGYSYGYEDTKNNALHTVAATERQTLHFGEPLVIANPSSFPIIAFLGGSAVYAGTATPVGALAAPPGSVYLRNSGLVYIKESGTDSSGWTPIPTLTRQQTWTATNVFSGGLRVPVSATGTRPNADAGSGQVRVDSTLNKLIFSDGTNWRDATGAVV